MRALFSRRKNIDYKTRCCYHTCVLGREAETDGLNFWTNDLYNFKVTDAQVAQGFIFSQEWADTCATYGIRSGCNIKASKNIKPTDLTYGFVERLYMKAFNRDFDSEGREYRANLLSNYSITGEQAGANFFLSKEMEDYHLSNEEFVNRLYATFMDREGEKAGVDYWVGVLAAGASRESVVYGFTRSPEFTEKCVVARILPY